MERYTGYEVGISFLKKQMLLWEDELKTKKREDETEYLNEYGKKRRKVTEREDHDAGGHKEKTVNE
jgi:hypothetical protein